MGAHRSLATVFRKISISIPRGRESNGDRKRKGRRWRQKKGRDFRRLVGPRFNVPHSHPFLPSVNPLPSPLTAIRERVYFCNLLEDRQLDFLGSFGYRISVRLRRSGLDPGRPKRPANVFPGEWPRGPPTPASYNSAFSYLISSTLSERVWLNMHGAFIYYLRRLRRKR